MELTGTIEERIAAAVEFAKAHRAYEYDHEAFVERYRRAGVPYTEAAEKFCREWDGVFDHCRFCRRNKSRIDFRFVCALDVTAGETPEEALRCFYDSYAFSEENDRDPDDTHKIRNGHGHLAVPVATGGHYYYDIIWVKTDGSLIAILPDGGRENEFRDLLDYLCSEFGFAGTPDSVECDIEGKELEGTTEERCAAAVGFACEHGGFEHCRLFTNDPGRDVIDFSEIIDDMKSLDRDTLSERLCRYCTEYYDQEKYPGRTLTLRGIRFVEE